ncbi:MAG TPA: hypothetical protein VGQ36_03370 [Thermoanaerobaculia bacterium]|jgi:hypothetical protein|nr:hypothetical protein [Thermoanaerobaculia bacterium]
MSAARRLLAVAALALFAILPAEAQRRRAVRSNPGTPSAACHTFGLVQAGTKASYLTTAPGGNVTFTITWISDTPTQTKTTQKVLSQGTTTDVETVLDGEIVGTLRALKHFNVKGTTTVPIFGALTTETDITFIPSLVSGPAAGWCVGNTWNVAPVTEQILVKSPQGNFPSTVTTVASTGEVLAVGESLTVDGGTFNTVKYRGAIVSGTSVQTAITWVSMQHNIVVRQDTVDAAGTVTSVTKLTSLQ